MSLLYSRRCYIICTDHVSTYCTSRTAGRCLGTPQKGRGAAGITTFPHQVMPLGIPVLVIEKPKCWWPLERIQSPSFKSFSTVIWHPEHVREWLQHSAAPRTTFASVLFKDTLDPTCTSKIQKVVDVRPPTSISKRLPSTGLKRMPTSVGLNQPPFYSFLV